jgi:hypothetical protein
MGILDFLSDNWQSILGNGAGAPGGGTFAPMPAAAPSAPPTGGYSPSGVGDINPITNQPPYYDPGIGIQTPGFDPMAGVSQNPTVASLKIDPLTGAPKGSELDLTGGGYGGGYTPPAPPMAPPGNAAAVAGGPPMAPPAPGPGMPLNIAPTNPAAPAGPPMNIAPNAAAANPNASRLAMLLGAQQGSPWKNAVQSGLSALGGGLSTVQGNTGAGAFARGMGGALTAGSRNQQQQQVQNFNMASTYFRNMLAARNEQDLSAYRKGLIGVRAQQAQRGSTAYQNDPFWKTMKIEDNVNKWQTQEQDRLYKSWKAFNDGGNPISSEDMHKQQDALDAQVAKRRAQLYKSAGLTQAEAQKQLTMGQEPPLTADGKPNPNFNPFQTKGMTPEEFNAKVPALAWYIDQNGKPQQRGYDPNMQPVQPAPSSAEVQSAPSNAQWMEQYENDRLANEAAQ